MHVIQYDHLFLHDSSVLNVSLLSYYTDSPTSVQQANRGEFLLVVPTSQKKYTFRINFVSLILVPLEIHPSFLPFSN